MYLARSELRIVVSGRHIGQYISSYIVLPSRSVSALFRHLHPCAALCVRRTEPELQRRPATCFMSKNGIRSRHVVPSAIAVSDSFSLVMSELVMRIHQVFHNAVLSDQTTHDDPQ